MFFSRAQGLSHCVFVFRLATPPPKSAASAVKRSNSSEAPAITRLLQSNGHLQKVVAPVSKPTEKPVAPGKYSCTIVLFKLPRCLKLNPPIQTRPVTYTLSYFVRPSFRIGSIQMTFNEPAWGVASCSP